MTHGLTEAELAFLHETFDLAREGATHSPNGSTRVVRALLDRGADHSRVNDKGQTALGAAVFRQSRPVVELLLAAGADPSLGRQSGLAVAEVFGLPEMTALLQSRS